MIILTLLTGLWFDSNAEFVERANENAAEGMSWHYVGKQEPDGNPALTIKAQNGQEFVLFKMQ